jgi:hypothetical protein
VSYIADATRLTPGSIVKIERPVSSSGKPTYPHFFIVVFVPDQPKPGDVIRLVGVSSRIGSSDVDPAKHVAMKWLARKGGDPETGFDKPCHACADFLCRLIVTSGSSFPIEVEAEYRGKYIRADKLQAVVATVNAWNRRKQ